MAAIVQYTITNNSDFINVDGVVGTSVADISYSLEKINILKFTKNVAQGAIGIVMLDNTDFWFKYTEVIDPSTGVPFAALNTFESFIETLSTTSVTTLAAETAWPGLTAYVDDGAGTPTQIIDATAAFTLAAITDVIGYKVYSVTDGTYGNVLSFVSGTTINTVGGTIVSWAGDAFKIPVAKRYGINMDAYKFLSFHYRLTADLHTCYTLKVYGTLDATATLTADDKWVNLSLSVLGAAAGIVADGITAATTVVAEDIVIIDTPTPMLKYMIKIVAEGNASAATGSSATVFVKKSS